MANKQQFFRPFLLLGNGGKNSILNFVLKLSLVQQKVFNPSALNSVFLLFNKA